MENMAANKWPELQNSNTAPPKIFLRSLMKRKSSVLTAAILAVFLAVPITQAAATTLAKPDVNTPMKEATRASYELRNTADTLHAITRSGRLTWQSHSSYLKSAREHVNQLGKILTNLENLKPHATDTQQMAIEAMRPRLAETANALTNAIELLNERRHNVYFGEYRDAVQTVSEQAASLHQTLDATLAYEAAKAKLNSLELSPAAEAGS
jgi:hypothetical protein